VSGERFLVTGAFGCIGAWTVAQLVAERVPVVAFDAGDDPRRLRLLLADDQLATLPIVRGDLGELASFEAALDEHAITNVIHLAALQVPFCAADPPLGARVNVVGTVNVFEAVRARQDRMATLVYASSIAAYDALEEGSDAPVAMEGVPSTLYGVFKRANEGTAQVYWRDHGLTSIGLRPHTVFGLGRDQGLTSAPTAAMLAAAAGDPFHIPFGGGFQLQYAPDVARAFVDASRARHAGALVANLGGAVVTIDQVIAAIEAAAPEARGSITAAREALPFPAEVEFSPDLERVIGRRDDTPLEHGVRDTITHFRDLLRRGLVAPPELPA
jgi:nucleoside-diphosphate-sugar epimerase